MTDQHTTIERALHPLLGLALVRSHRGADLRVFHFDVLTPTEWAEIARYALHIQCPWRILIPGDLDSHVVVAGGRIKD